MSTGQKASQLVYVAMSGGVDSSVAAALLKQRGFKVVGVFFKPWSPFAKASVGRSNPIYFCDWKQDRQDAMAVASVLGIPFKTWDFSKEYKAKVGDYMIDTYREGLTPNPDVRCNKEIKFGLFLKRALAEGADYIATGHYARKRESKDQNAKIKITHQNLKIFQLLKGRDRNKDQTYFLWTLTQKELKYCLFPIGDFTKPEVRELAKKFGLPNHAKKDSQGVCFIGQLNMSDFLKFYIKPKPGKIKLFSTKEILGEHEGVSFFTIGQRRGLNTKGGGGPYYVVEKDLKKNIVYVAKTDETSLQSDWATVTELSWINQKPIFPVTVKVKARYRTKEVSAKLFRKTAMVSIKLAQPIRAITPGQSIVFYRGQEVLGGGVIGSRS